MSEQSIFLTALDITDLTERAAYIAATCAGDDALRTQVESLLAAHERPGAFLDEPAVAQMADSGAGETRTVVPGTDSGFARTRLSDSVGASDDDVLPFLNPPARAGSLGRLAHYEIQEVLGRGGFGTVLKAFDERLHRVVAIKVMAPQLAASGAARARFLREGRSAAAVRDDHVVNVHHVSGDDEAMPYLVMEFVAGQTLQQKIDKVGPLSVAEVLRIGGQVARGLAAAHATGLIHRDIKPANILLENGVERVKITDFGLARAADDASISQSGVVAGTPMYMAPEQARGDAIDHRADLFCLGSVLYAMCTGRPPFRAETTLAVLKRVCEDDPRPVREVNPAIPPWLADVVAKLHAKNAADRFQTAKEVADLLARYLSELQTNGDVKALPSARPVPKPRRRRVARVAVLLAALGLIGTAVAFHQPILLFVSNRGELILEDPESDFEVTIVQRGDVIHDRSTQREFVLSADRGTEIRVATRATSVPLFTKDVAIERGGRVRVNLAHELAEVERRHRERVSNNLDNIGKAVHDFGKDGWAQLFNGTNLDGWTPQPALTGKWEVKAGALVLTGLAQLESVRDYRDFHLRASVRSSAGHNATLAFRAAANKGQGIVGFDRRLDSPCRPGTTGVWRDGWESIVEYRLDLVPASEWIELELIVRGNRVKVTINGTTTTDATAENLPDNGRFKLQTHNVGGVLEFRKIEIRELPPGAPGEVRRFVGHTGPIRAVTFSPDGLRVLSSSGFPHGDRTLRLWDVASGKELQRFEGHTGVINGVAFSPDGSRIFSAGAEDRVVRVWDAATGKELAQLEGHTDGVCEVTVSPDGRHALSSSLDRTVRLWDLTTFTERRRYEGHEGLVTGVAFSPDARRFVSASWDGTARFWDVATGKELKRFEGHEGAVWRVAFTPDGDRLVSCGDDGTLRVWDLATAREVQRMTGHTLQVFALALSRSGHHVLSGSGDGTVRLWEVATGKELHRFEGNTELVWGVAISPDGESAACGGGGGLRDGKWVNGTDWAVRLWRLPPGAPGPAPKDALAFDGTGHVELPLLPYTAGAPLCVEMWTTPGAPPEDQKAPSGHARQTLWGSGFWSLMWHEFDSWSFARPQTNQVFSRTNPVVDRRTHLAAVWDGKTIALFVDGQLQQRSPPSPRAELPLANEKSLFFNRLGAANDTPKGLRAPYFGTIEQVRVSRIARYADDFKPPARFETDPDTVALYRFEEGKGDTLTDASGNNLHGKIHGAKWVKVGASVPPPLAVAPFDAAKAKDHQDAWAKHLGVEPEFENSIGMKLRLVPPGGFTMGTPPDVLEAVLKRARETGVPGGEVALLAGEGVPRPVRLTRPYYVGSFEVTRKQFGKFVTATGYKTELEENGKGGFSNFKGKWVQRPEHVWRTPGEWAPGPDEPVVHITPRDAEAFCAWLSKVEGVRYVLLTEAQWEFACRAGTVGVDYATAGQSLADLAWTAEQYGDHVTRPDTQRPRVVGQKRPNAFGLYDMLGNVWEYVDCYYVPGPDRAEPQTDPTGPRNGIVRTIRGGAWYRPGDIFARSGTRTSAGFRPDDFCGDAGTGFRVGIVGDLKPKPSRVPTAPAPREKDRKP